MSDHYAVLGVEPSATPRQITRAYRKLAKELHPDTNPGGEERFKAITAAYDVLSDPEKRREYDEERTRPRARPRPQSTPHGRSSPGVSPFDFAGDDVWSNLSDLFGGSRPAPPSATANLEITLLDAMRGITISATLPQPCPGCQGTGVVGSAACSTCGGSGQAASAPTKVRIPVGIADGQQLRARTPAGDLLVTVHVIDDACFTRQGDDLVTTVKAPLTTALLGGELTVATLDQTVTVRVPAGTSSGATLRVRGRGVPAHANKPAGDLLVRVAVTVPRHLTADQRAAAEAFARALES